MEFEKHDVEWLELMGEIIVEHSFISKRERDALKISVQVINEGFESLTNAEALAFNSIFEPLFREKQHARHSLNSPEHAT